jgi:hypothetical protein
MVECNIGRSGRVLEDPVFVARALREVIGDAAMDAEVAHRASADIECGGVKFFRFRIGVREHTRPGAAWPQC